MVTRIKVNGVDTVKIVKRKTRESAIPLAALNRLVREIGGNVRWGRTALKAMQVDAEAYLIEEFQRAKGTLDLFGKKTLKGMLRLK